jgi:predicted peptidase
METGFIHAQVTRGSTTMVYTVYVPWDYTPEKQWPVIVSLHGDTLEGNDGIKPMMYGLGQQVWLHPERFPCLVLFPQLPQTNRFITWTDSPYESMTIRILNDVILKYNGDRNRLYLTGFSKGDGWGTAANFPTLFAAAVPTAGAPCAKDELAWVSSQLRRMPLWVIMGENDNAECARAVVAALRKAGNTNVQYTEYPGIGHDSWDLAYGDPKVIEWLLAQKR